MAHNDILDQKQLGMTDWFKTAEFSVGGFLYLGFSKVQKNKFICISGEYIAFIDCDTGKKITSAGTFDEIDFTAECSNLPGEIIDIFGEYGGVQRLCTAKGDKVTITQHKEPYGKFGKDYLIRTEVIFESTGSRITIHNDYGFYCCSFSPCGEYFAIATDSGVTVYGKRR